MTEPLTNEQCWGVPDVCEYKGVVCDYWNSIEKKCRATDGCVVQAGPDENFNKEVQK